MSYSPTQFDLDVLLFFEKQEGPTTVNAAIEGTGLERKDASYSITKLTKAGWIETTGKRPQTNADGTPKRGRPSRLIAITEEGVAATGF